MILFGFFFFFFLWLFCFVFSLVLVFCCFFLTFFVVFFCALPPEPVCVSVARSTSAFTFPYRTFSRPPLGLSLSPSTPPFYFPLITSFFLLRSLLAPSPPSFAVVRSGSVSFLSTVLAENFNIFMVFSVVRTPPPLPFFFPFEQMVTCTVSPAAFLSPPKREK